MDFKRFAVFGLFLFILMGFVCSATITDYIVPSNIPLNMPMTATGIYSDVNQISGIKCSFFFFDGNELIDRATDEYTAGTGRFGLVNYYIREPTFQRGKTYSLRSECGGAFATADFIVGQKEEVFEIWGFKLLPDSIAQDLLYWNGKSGLIIFLIFCGVLLVILWDKIKKFIPNF
jgi:hypothetical protein